MPMMVRGSLAEAKPEEMICCHQTLVGVQNGLLFGVYVDGRDLLGKLNTGIATVAVGNLQNMYPEK